MRDFDFSKSAVGDKVFLNSRGWGRFMEVATIEKIGKLHITVRGQKYGIKNGNRAGSPYHGDYLSKFSESEWNEYLADKRIERVRRELGNYKWSECPKEIAETIYSLLPKEPKP